MRVLCLIPTLVINLDGSHYFPEFPAIYNDQHTNPTNSNTSKILQHINHVRDMNHVHDMVVQCYTYVTYNVDINSTNTWAFPGCLPHDFLLHH